MSSDTTVGPFTVCFLLLSLGPEPVLSGPCVQCSPQAPAGFSLFRFPPSRSWFGCLWIPSLGRFAPQPTKHEGGGGLCFPSGCLLCARVLLRVGAVSLGWQCLGLRPSPASPCPNPAGLSSLSPVLHSVAVVWPVCVHPAAFTEPAGTGGADTASSSPVAEHRTVKSLGPRRVTCPDNMRIVLNGGEGTRGGLPAPLCPLEAPPGRLVPAPAFPPGSQLSPQLLQSGSSPL